MQSMKARKALLDDAIVECAVSIIWDLFIHIPSCHFWVVIRRIYIVRFKAEFKTKQETTPTTITDKGKIQDSRKMNKTLPVWFLVSFLEQVLRSRLCSWS